MNRINPRFNFRVFNRRLNKTLLFRLSLALWISLLNSGVIFAQYLQRGGSTQEGFGPLFGFDPQRIPGGPWGYGAECRTVGKPCFAVGDAPWSIPFDSPLYQSHFLPKMADYANGGASLSYMATVENPKMTWGRWFTEKVVGYIPPKDRGYIFTFEASQAVDVPYTGALWAEKPFVRILPNDASPFAISPSPKVSAWGLPYYDEGDCSVYLRRPNLGSQVQSLELKPPRWWTPYTSGIPGVASEFGGVTVQTAAFGPLIYMATGENGYDPQAHAFEPYTLAGNTSLGVFAPQIQTTVEANNAIRNQCQELQQEIANAKSTSMPTYPGNQRERYIRQKEQALEEAIRHGLCEDPNSPRRTLAGDTWNYWTGVASAIGNALTPSWGPSENPADPFEQQVYGP